MKMSTKNKMILLSCVIVLAIITVVSLLNFDMNKILETVEAMPIGLKVLSMIGLIAAQIFLAFLPGEPLELASGYLFGAWNGYADLSDRLISRDPACVWPGAHLPS